MSPAAPVEGSKLMEKFKADDRSAYAQATKRRDGAMREMLGMGSDPVGHAEADKHHKPQVVIWRVAGNRDRTSAGWADPVAISVQCGGPGEPAH